jgi:hypothetical protein
MAGYAYIDGELVYVDDEGAAVEAPGYDDSAIEVDAGGNQGAVGGTTLIENPSKEGDPGYGWQYYSDGTVISPDGKYYTSDSEGVPVYTPPSNNSWWEGIFTKGGKFDLPTAVKAFGSTAAAIWAWDAAKNPPKTGYQGGIPSLTAVRNQLGKQPDATRPGAGGHRYFTDTAYGNKDNLGQVQATIDNQAVGLSALNAKNATEKAGTQATRSSLTDKQQLNALYQANKSNPSDFAQIQAQNGWSDADVSSAIGMSGTQFANWKDGKAAVSRPVATGTTSPAPAATGAGSSGIASLPAATSSRAPTTASASADASYQQKMAAGDAFGYPGKVYGKMPTDHTGILINGDPNSELPIEQVLSFFKNNPINNVQDLAKLYKWGNSIGLSNLGLSQARAYAYQQLGIDTYSNMGGLGDDPNATKWDALLANTQPGSYVVPNAQGIAAPDIKNWVAQHGKDANYQQAAQQAIQQYGLTPTDLQAAGVSPTGFNFAATQSAPAPAPAPAPAAPQGISNADISNFYNQNANNPAAIKAAMAQYGVTADQAAAATGRSASDFQFAQGGLTALAKGGQAMRPRYLQGNTDGMADKIPAQIDGHQPAALAHGEFVIPADVVSHLGNGNSDAGAKQLYKMMDKIRMARTGRKSQGKEINPEKFTVGGPAYAAGGHIPGYAGTTDGSLVNAGVTGTESSLSNWVGPYVTNMLGKGQALAESPNPVYQGPLTAGDSALQSQAYGNAANLRVPGSIGAAADTAGQVGQAAGNVSYDPSVRSFTQPGVAQQFMSPYMNNVVKYQQQDAQRQADIASSARNAQMATQGAFGGSRGAIMGAEAARGLANQQGQIQAQGLQSAYTAGQGQFNTENQMQNQNTQFGANLGMQGLNTQLQAANTQGQLGVQQNQAGLANLNTQASLGAMQQGTEQAGMTADQNAFNQERDNPFKMVQFQQSLLQGLPLAAQSYTTTTNPWNAAANAAGAVLSSPATK